MEKILLAKNKTWWGAEPAADIYTNDLKPGELTLYTVETKRELMKNYRMIPNDKGPIKVYQKFWQLDDIENNKLPTAPLLLVYADLINTGDRRYMQTAQKIYE